MSRRARQKRGLTKRFTERLEPGRAFREARVEGNTIQGVAVLTPRSVNGGPEGRRYAAAARQDAANRINEGTVRGFADHSRDDQRSVRDLVGTFSRGRVDGSGVVRANLHLLDTDLRPLILSAAREEPAALALSIDARGAARMEGDQQVVESIEVLRSVDVVSTPASTSSLFETLQEGVKEDEHEARIEEMRRRLFGNGGERPDGPSRRQRYRPIPDRVVEQSYTRLFG